VSTSLSRGERAGHGQGQGHGHGEASSTVRVQVAFRDVQNQQADAIAAELIGRAHELANLPEYECDVDVNVRIASAQDDGARDSRAR
jgi:hypothetical protein